MPDLRSSAIRLAATLPSDSPTREALLGVLREAASSKSWADGDTSAPVTIWGRAQFMTEIMRGVRWFSTAGHGGLAVADGVARKFLSPAAYKLGDRANGYVWYEEDSAFSIPFYEQPEWAASIARANGSPVRSKEYWEDVVRRWYPEYFRMVADNEPLPTKIRAGEKVKFVKNTSFGRQYLVPAGTEAEVFKTTGSMIYLRLPMAPHQVRVPLRAFDDGSYLVRL